MNPLPIIINMDEAIFLSMKKLSVKSWINILMGIFLIIMGPKIIIGSFGINDGKIVYDLGGIIIGLLGGGYGIFLIYRGLK